MVAHRESETEAERNQYTYRQTVRIVEVTERGAQTGEYREVRDVIFSPAKERSEEIIGAPFKNLKNLILTDEDFRDIRDIQPFVLVEDFLPIYETKFRGEEKMDGVDCWVLQVAPRQILAGQRLFDGMLWVSKADYSVIRSEGQAVPQIRTTKSENLFPKVQVPGFDKRGRYAVFPHGPSANPDDDPIRELQEVRGGNYGYLRREEVNELSDSYVFSLQAFWTLLDFELHRGAFVQRAVAIRLDGGKVDEHVVTG